MKPAIDLDEEKLKSFKEATKRSYEQASDVETWMGQVPRHWAEYVIKRSHHKFMPEKLPTDRLSRQALKEICHVNSGYSNEECVASIMAWGGQNRKHGVLVFNRFNEITNTVSKLRSGVLNRCEAYQAFYDIWMQKEPLGMGAAYFTKIIFFCGKDHNGYIMDQWTSKSANILNKTPLIKLSSGHVNKKNGVEQYKLFCELVETVAEIIDLTAENVELSMFSRGGRQKLPWRKFVIENYKK
ncbi:MAG: hypothetical protein IBX55_15200 [Methyloprofundus sp.]|nr:hypothetical protein [Methyloprofundus sp.]